MEPTTQSWTDTEELQERAGGTAQAGRETINRITETMASKTPTTLFMFAALASIAVSATLQLRGNRQWSLFIGQWAPSFLLFGLYNKFAKTVGAD